MAGYVLKDLEDANEAFNAAVERLTAAAAEVDETNRKRRMIQDSLYGVPREERFALPGGGAAGSSGNASGSVQFSPQPR